jgi:3-methyladenine DNA glycosylase AlkD
MTKKIFPYNSEIEEQIKQIKQALHLRMNGEVAGLMTRKGLSYKLNYGTLLPELKAISQKFPQNKLLAERLWYMEVRETMILATLLYPINEFTLQVAEEWVKQISTTEISEIAGMNIFSKIPQAEELALKWIENPKAIIRLSGWIVLTRIASNLSTEGFDFSLKQAVNSIKNADDSLRNKIILALKKMLVVNSGKVMSSIDEWKNNLETENFYSEIKAELINANQ